MANLAVVVAGLAVVGLLWWAGFWLLAVFVVLVCGLAALVHLGRRRRPTTTEGEPDEKRRVLRDFPPPPTG